MHEMWTLGRPTDEGGSGLTDPYIEREETRTLKLKDQFGMAVFENGKLFDLCLYAAGLPQTVTKSKHLPPDEDSLQGWIQFLTFVRQECLRLKTVHKSAQVQM